MELRQLQYFAAVYEEGSVTRASQRLNVVQPALSQQVSKLEEELGSARRTLSQGLRVLQSGGHPPNPASKVS